MTFRVKQLSNNEVEITIVPTQMQSGPSEPLMRAEDYLQSLQSAGAKRRLQEPRLAI